MAAITALGGLLFGYDTGVVSGALLFLKNDFPHISSFQKELVTSLLLVGAVIGAIGAGGWPTVSAGAHDLITAVVFIVGVLLAAFTPTYVVLLVARVIIGLARRVGLDDRADVHRRGRRRRASAAAWSA